MAKDNYPADPGKDANLFPNKVDTTQIAQASNFTEFPYADSRLRLAQYRYYESLFIGDHFTAFNITIDNEMYGREYAKLRYVKANFAGLISRVIADFLFSEPITIKCPEGDQDFIDALVRSNKLDTQLYESELSNSYNGDALFKIRAGARKSTDKNSTLIIEDITPSIYFPKVDGFNVRAEPEVEELAWTFTLNNIKYLRKEIHKPGVIINEIWEMKGDKIVAKVDLSLLPLDLVEMVSTRVDRNLLFHVPNWKAGNRFFGISDYYDLDSLFYAINNRLTKTDNILDKHSDPILMVPPGVLDDKGQVKKKALGVIEIGEGENNKPEYIVWDASLENAFKELEKLVDVLLMTSEISPDVFGRGTGQSDSGRAIKYKLLRTIAKAARKKLYYDTAIKDMLFTAQEFAKAYGLEVDGVKLQGDPAPIEIEWKDGIPVDETEQIDNEIKAVDAGLTSKLASIQRIYGVDEESAQRMLDEIEKEKPKIELPSMNMGDKSKVGGGVGVNNGNMMNDTNNMPMNK